MTCAPIEDTGQPGHQPILILASAQSDQSLRCRHDETFDPSLPIERTMKTLIRLGGCPG